MLPPRRGRRRSGNHAGSRGAARRVRGPPHRKLPRCDFGPGECEKSKTPLDLRGHRRRSPEWPAYLQGGGGSAHRLHPWVGSAAMPAIAEMVIGDLPMVMFRPNPRAHPLLVQSHVPLGGADRLVSSHRPRGSNHHHHVQWHPHRFGSSSLNGYRYARSRGSADQISLRLGRCAPNNTPDTSATKKSRVKDFFTGPHPQSRFDSHLTPTHPHLGGTSVYEHPLWA